MNPMPKHNMTSLNRRAFVIGTAGAGSGSHIAGLYFESATGIKLQYVPYRGTAPALTDLVAGQIDIMIDQGPNARSVRLTLPRFTLIGATTRAGLLTSPLRSRFTLQTRLDYYDRETLHSIVRRTCGLLKVAIDDEGAGEIARRARGTPRVANNLINFIRDFAQERAKGAITREVAAAGLELLEIDASGLDEMDKRMLRAMAENYRGGPVGMSTIAVAVGEESETLEEVHEPFLIQEGYLQRTPQGRVLTEKGYAAVGLKPAGGGQGSFL